MCTQRFLAEPLMAFGGTLAGKQCPMLSHPGSEVTYENIHREMVLKVMRVVLEVVVVKTTSQHHGAECIWSKHSVKSKNYHASTMLTCSLKPASSPCHEENGFAYLHFQSSLKFHFNITSTTVVSTWPFHSTFNFPSMSRYIPFRQCCYSVVWLLWQ